MRKKSIVFVLCLVFILSGCSVSNDKSTNNTTKTNTCFSTGKELISDTRVSAEIAEALNPLNLVIKDKYTTEELKNLAYGANFTETEAGYHGTYELCDLNNNEVLSEGYFEKDDSSYHINTSLENYGVYTETKSGSKSNFLYTVDGIEKLEVVAGGKYAVNVFILPDGEEDWQLADVMEFEVE